MERARRWDDEASLFDPAYCKIERVLAERQEWVEVAPATEDSDNKGTSEAEKERLRIIEQAKANATNYNESETYDVVFRGPKLGVTLNEKQSAGGSAMLSLAAFLIQRWRVSMPTMTKLDRCSTLVISSLTCTTATIKIRQNFPFT